MSTTSTDRRLVALLLAALGVLVVLPLVFMGSGMMGYMGFGPMMGIQSGVASGVVPGWMLVVGLVMQVLFLAVLVGAGYLLYRLVLGDTARGDALEELRLAYARGEIDDDEYDRRREVLERD